MRPYPATSNFMPFGSRTVGSLISIFALLLLTLSPGCSSDDSPTEPKTSVPATPTGVAATAASGTVTVSWAAVDGATGYKVYWDTAGSVDATDPSIDVAASPFVHSSLANGTTYSYRVGAVNAAGSSGLSGQVSATPNGALGIRLIACGKSSSFLVDSNGNLFAWGANGIGQLGVGSFSQKSVPTRVNGISDVVAVASGEEHTLVLTGSGHLYAMGNNIYGTLGVGDNQPRWSPTLVSAPVDFVAVAAGRYHSLGVTSDGKVWAWGNNSGGHLGLGHEGGGVQTPSLVLTSILGTPGLVAAGYWTNFFKPDDTPTQGSAIFSWGSRSFGALGRGDIVDTDIANTPSIISSTVMVTAISTRYQHVLALRDDGSVLSWGANSEGQLGDAPVTSRNAPDAVNLVHDVRAVAAGAFHSLALGNDGRVMAWGSNGFGQLGDGSYDNSSTRLWVENLTGIIMIASGDSHNLALRNDGTVWAWGKNTNGQLGDGTSAGRSEARRVNGY